MELVLELVEKIIPTGRGTPLGVNLCFVGRAGYTGPSPRTDDLRTAGLENIAHLNVGLLTHSI